MNGKIVNRMIKTHGADVGQQMEKWKIKEKEKFEADNKEKTKDTDSDSQKIQIPVKLRKSTRNYRE